MAAPLRYPLILLAWGAMAAKRVIRGTLRVAWVTTALFSITRMVLNFHTAICLPFRP